MLISCFSRPGFPFYTPSHPPLSPHGFYPPINPLGRPFLLWIARVSLRNKLPQFFYTIGWMGKQDSIKQYNSIRTRIKILKMLVTFTSLSSISNQQMHGWLLSCSDRRANDAAMPEGWNTFLRDSFYLYHFLKLWLNAMLSFCLGIFWANLQSCQNFKSIPTHQN